MQAPPTWFDFSTECIYTAQKHKRHKVWRDGICTCIFVRGWIVLKLFPEGASITSEPLEDWRIPTDTPAAVANQEIELQVHLVQLLGRPQPLDEQRRLSQLGSQAKTIPTQAADPLRLQSPGAFGDNVLFPKKRFPGGLLRPRGISPQSFPKLRGGPVQDLSSKRLDTNGKWWKSSAQTESQGTSAICAAIVAQEEPREASTAMPTEVAWHMNAARSVLVLTCCCSGGCSNCSRYWTSEAFTIQDTAAPEFFKKIFSSASAHRLSRLDQEAGKNEIPLFSFVQTTASGKEGKPALIRRQNLPADAQDDSCSNGFHLGSGATCAGSQIAPRHLTPPSVGQYTTGSGALLRAGNSARAGAVDAETANGRGKLAANARHSSAEIHACGKHLDSTFQQASRSRFVALATGALSPNRGSAYDKLSHVHGSPRLPGLCKQPHGQSCVAVLSNGSGAVPITISKDNFGSTGHKEKQTTIYQQRLQQEHLLPCEPQQRGTQRVAPSRRTGSASIPLPERPPVLVVEGVPQMHGNMADFLPVTFSTGPEVAPPFCVSERLAISTSSREMGHL